MTVKVEEPKTPEIDHGHRTRKLTALGIGLTVGWLIFLAVLLHGRSNSFSGLKLNELGDFLAGVGAPVALLWLVLGYFQQGLELRQNTEALKLQYEELKRQVNETAELAKAAGRQAAAAENLVAVTGDSAKQTAEQVEASHRPIFSYSGAKDGPDGRAMKITNIGATVSSVKIIALASGGHLSQLEIGNWINRGEISLKIFADATFPIFMKFEFTNGLQVKKAHYHLVPEFGKFEGVAPEEVESHFAAIAAGN